MTTVCAFEAREGVLAGLLPAAVAVRETTGDAGEDELFAAELGLIDRAVPKRRAEFTTVRACARRALADLGVAPAAIRTGERGEPLWPAGIRGSMTHCVGFRAAAVALESRVWSVGIDAEPDLPLPAGVLRSIALPDEQVHLTALAARDRSVSWGRVLFSAKESVYKTWFPLQRAWLDFDEARVRIDPAGAAFSAELLVPGPVLAGRRHQVLHGRFAARGGLIVTAIALVR